MIGCAPARSAEKCKTDLSTTVREGYPSSEKYAPSVSLLFCSF